MLKVQLPPIQQGKGSSNTQAPLPREKAGTPGTSGTSSPYRERVRAVLGALDDLPPGMSPWLQRAKPELFAHCVDLLKQVDVAWGTSMVEFDQALWLFELAFRKARELYRAHLQKPTRGVLEGLQRADGEDGR